MKVQVSNTNAPCWRDITVKSKVPAQLDILQEMARNISWVWHSEAIEMFRSIDPVFVEIDKRESCIDAFSRLIMNAWKKLRQIRR